jgi:hypothetical protein
MVDFPERRAPVNTFMTLFSANLSRRSRYSGLAIMASSQNADTAWHQPNTAA